MQTFCWIAVLVCTFFCSCFSGIGTNMMAHTLYEKEKYRFAAAWKVLGWINTSLITVGGVIAISYILKGTW